MKGTDYFRDPDEPDRITLKLKLKLKCVRKPQIQVDQDRFP
jgi:hypothetical protein